MSGHDPKLSPNVSPKIMEVKTKRARRINNWPLFIVFLVFGISCADAWPGRREPGQQGKGRHRQNDGETVRRFRQGTDLRSRGGDGAATAAGEESLAA